MEKDELLKKYTSCNHTNEKSEDLTDELVQEIEKQIDEEIEKIKESPVMSDDNESQLDKIIDELKTTQEDYIEHSRALNQCHGAVNEIGSRQVKIQESLFMWHIGTNRKIDDMSKFLKWIKKLSFLSFIVGGVGIYILGGYTFDTVQPFIADIAKEIFKGIFKGDIG